jgi:hypothetical protein
MTQYLINNLGTFDKYTPESGDTTKGYAKRESDGVDFATFTANPANFDPYSVKMMLATASVYPGTPAILTTTGAVSFDATALIYSTYSPATFTLIEVLDYVGYDPALDFQSHGFDITSTPGSAIVTPPPAGVLAPPSGRSLLPVFKRSTTLEAATIETILGTFSPRDRRLLDMNYALSTSDPLFQQLASLFIAAFGRPRAQVLLSSSL